MRDDPIVNEVRKEREKNAARFNFDPQAIAEDARKRQRKSGREAVTPQRKANSRQ